MIMLDGASPGGVVRDLPQNDCDCWMVPRRVGWGVGVARMGLGMHGLEGRKVAAAWLGWALAAIARNA